MSKLSDIELISVNNIRMNLIHQSLKEIKIASNNIPEQIF